MFKPFFPNRPLSLIVLRERDVPSGAAATRRIERHVPALPAAWRQRHVPAWRTFEINKTSSDTPNYLTALPKNVEMPFQRPNILDLLPAI